MILRKGFDEYIERLICVVGMDDWKQTKEISGKV